MPTRRIGCAPNITPNYVLSCPKSSTTTIFESEAPKGFYVQLDRGQVRNG